MCGRRLPSTRGRPSFDGGDGIRVVATIAGRAAATRRRESGKSRDDDDRRSPTHGEGLLVAKAMLADIAAARRCLW